MATMTTATAPRHPSDWVEDMSWHRRMYRQSRFRWMPEDPAAIALTWTRGRLEYATPGDMRLLDRQLDDLREFASGIDLAMLEPLAEAERRCSANDWSTGLELTGMSTRDLKVLRHGAPHLTTVHREARRAMRGIPWPNPFSRVWELRQMRGMYRAAEQLLEDTFCDLTIELAPAQGWQHLSQMTLYHRSARTLQSRVEDQREARGVPGDLRREPSQRY